MRIKRWTFRAKWQALGAIAIVAALVLSGCSSEAAKPTEVKIVAPAPGTVINVGQGTVIQGEANGDNITRVEVVVDGKAYASLSTPDKTKGVPNFPVSVPWTPLSAGTHALQLRAFGLEDKLLGQSEPLVVDAKAAVAAATTAPQTTAAPVATATPGGNQPADQPTAAAQPTTASDAPSLVVTNDFVNVRTGPNIGYQLLGRLDKGQNAPVRGKSQDGNWWQIAFASGPNGVGWVFGEYVQANSAAASVPVAAAPALPTSPPRPVAPTAPPPTVGVVPTAVPSMPIIGSKGQLRVDRNPVASGGSVNAYWNVPNIQGIWFDKGDGSGFLPAAGSQTVAVSNITSQRTLQLRWKDGAGVETTDALIVYLSGQVVSTLAPLGNCDANNPDWRGANTNYPFCVRQDMEWVDGGGAVRYFNPGENKATGMKWNIYGIGGIWILIQPDSRWCGPAGGTPGRQISVAGEGTYSFNANEFSGGGYKISMRVKRNDGGEVDYNEKYMCIMAPPSNATATSVPPTATTPPTAVPPTEIPPPTAAP